MRIRLTGSCELSVTDILSDALSDILSEKVANDREHG